MALLPAILAKLALGKIVEKVLDRADVPIENKDVPAAVAKVEAAIDTAVKDKDIAVVTVKSAASSKINVVNWSAFIAGAATFAGYLGFEIPVEVVAAAEGVILGVVTVATWIMRTWFTTSITKSSAEG